MIRAKTVEDLRPLIGLCRAGRLFEVQQWIRDGKPIAPPESPPPRSNWANPLRVAMEERFHSLVQVLLEAGAPHVRGYYNALEHAVEVRRPDLASLLIRHGADVRNVGLRFVIENWHREMVELFLSHGASLVDGNPIAWGLIQKVKPALGLLKRYGEGQPGIMRQADIALRHHAWKGDAKWVALCLWAGADPWSRGCSDLDVYEDEDADDSGMCAVEIAAYRGDLALLRVKRMFCSGGDGSGHGADGLIEQACQAGSWEALEFVLERGCSPGDLPDRGTAAISRVVHSLCWEGPYSLPAGRTRRGIDTSRAMERMRMLHLLVARGAKWLPENDGAIGEVRGSLLKMASGYVLEFIWLMMTYRAARRRDIRELLRTSSMVALVARERAQADAMTSQLPEEPDDRPGAE